MPISAAGSKPRKGERGFTLIELLVVVTIIGLASAARDLAVVGAKPISVWVSEGGYGFDERVDGDWVAMAEKPLRVTHWGKGTHAVPVSGSRDRVLFDSVGSTDRPLDVTLERDAERLTVHIGSDGKVRVGG